MNRQQRLMKSEWLRLRRRGWGLFLCGVILLSGLFVLAGREFFWARSMERYTSPEALAADAKREMERLQAEQPEGYEIDLEKLRFLLEEGVPLSEPNWRLEAAERLASERKQLLSLLKNGLEDEQELTLRLASLGRDEKLIRAGDPVPYLQKKRAEMQQNPDLSEEDLALALWKLDYQLEYGIAEEENRWKYPVFSVLSGNIDRMRELERLADTGFLDSGYRREYRRLERELALDCYRLEQGRERIANPGSADYWDSEPFWSAAYQIQQEYRLPMLVLAALCGLLFGRDFSSGRMALLFGYPYRRGRIFSARLSLWGLLAVGVWLLHFFGSILAAGSFFGFGSLFSPALIWTESGVRELPGALPLLWEQLLDFPYYLLFGMLAWTLNWLLCNPWTAAGGTAVLVFLCKALESRIAYAELVSWTRVLLFGNLELSRVFQDNSTYFQNPPLLSIILLLLHGGVLLLISWDACVRREWG